ncbi:MAG TPA: isoamylase early set domain-containing protein [Streptosporangiaceae bacterium]
MSVVGTGTKGPRKIITMDSNNARRAGKQPYEAVRDQLDQLGEKVIERHWDEGAPVRQGYRRFLGAMDELAGRLLDDDEISQRGQDLRRDNERDEADESARAGDPAEADGTAGAGEAEAARGDAEATATDGAGVTDEVWTQASDEAEAADDRAAEEVQRTEEARKTEEALRADEAGVGESWAAGNTRVAEAQAAGVTGEAAGTERTVDVVFSLPAETQADRVALCGEFNDWSLESISLARGDDRAWRVTVPLVPGTYRYKFLLDGETWENGTDADRYEENAYGTQDSVIVVSG